jgi:hypothetical protein
MESLCAAIREFLTHLTDVGGAMQRCFPTGNGLARVGRREWRAERAIGRHGMARVSVFNHAADLGFRSWLRETAAIVFAGFFGLKACDR